MAAIKPLEQSSDKWQRRAAVAGPDLVAGIENPRRPWAQSAAEAEQSYRTGVTAAAQAGRYGAGVRKAGDEKWKSNSKSKAQTRYAEGVSLAVQEWQKGYAPYQSAIASLTLPPRGPRRSEANYNRSTAVGRALGQVKERSSGSTR